MHHGLTIGRDLDIDLDAVIGRDGCPNGGRRVFNHAMFLVMQSAMGDRARD